MNCGNCCFYVGSNFCTHPDVSGGFVDKCECPYYFIHREDYCCDEEFINDVKLAEERSEYYSLDENNECVRFSNDNVNIYKQACGLIAKRVECIKGVDVYNPYDLL